jgi:predicted component of type VI protein secretion system
MSRAAPTLATTGKQEIDGDGTFPMSEAAPRAAASVLDRLMDDGAPEDPRPSRAIHAALRRDLEALLNARRPWASVPDRQAALRRGIYGYGLPDFAAGAFNAPAQPRGPVPGD